MFCTNHNTKHNTNHDAPGFTINVRRRGMLVHQQNTCACHVYEQLRNLSSIFPPEKYNISYTRTQRTETPPAAQANGEAGPGLFINIKNLLSNN